MEDSLDADRAYDQREEEIKQYKEVVGILLDALRMYGDPEFYHAVMFTCDYPTGGFGYDFSEDHGHDFYERGMPGRLARNTIKEIVDKYPDLPYLDYE